MSTGRAAHAGAELERVRSIVDRLTRESQSDGPPRHGRSGPQVGMV